MKSIFCKMKYLVIVLLFFPTITFGQKYKAIPQLGYTDKYKFAVLLLCDSVGDIEYDNYHKINIIDIKTNAIHQTIDSIGIIGIVSTRDDQIEIGDYNFDGYPDFSIVSFADMHGDNIENDYYLYNPTTDKFYLIPIGYRAKDGRWCNLTNGQFNPNNKKIYENIDYKVYNLSEVHNEYKWCGDSIKLIKTDTLYFPPIQKLCDLLTDTIHIERMYGLRYDDPWNAIFHTFPVKEKENATVYLKLALIYSRDSLTYENDMDDNLSEVIIRQFVEAFPEDESGWLAYGDILYNKYLLTKDEDALSDMEDAYERYIELITGQREKTHRKFVKLYSDNILAFEKYCEKYKVWQIPVLIVKDGAAIYLEKTEDQDVYYFGDFTPSYSRKFIYMSKYYTTLEFPGSNKEILKFSNGTIIDSQTGKELLSLYGTDVAGEWNCDDEWVSGDQILFSPFSDSIKIRCLKDSISSIDSIYYNATIENRIAQLNSFLSKYTKRNKIDIAGWSDKYAEAHGQLSLYKYLQLRLIVLYHLDLIKIEDDWSVRFDLFLACVENNDYEVLDLLDFGDSALKMNNCYGVTVLTTAVWKNNIEMVKYLLKRGVDKNQRECPIDYDDDPEGGRNAYEIAVYLGYKDIADLLKEPLR